MNDTLKIKPIRAFRQTVRPPGSKSLTNRALLLASLAHGTSRLSNVLFSDDTRVMIGAFELLGFEMAIDELTGVIEIQGTAGVIPNGEARLFLGNAGTATRFLTAAVCLGQGRYHIDGIERMRQRPIHQLVEALKSVGATIDYDGEAGYPPLNINAHGLQKTQTDTRLPNTVSSQYISAMLQVGPYVDGGLTLHLDTPVISAPYVHMTLALMRQFGVDADAALDLSTIHIDATSPSQGMGGRGLGVPGCRGYRGCDLTIEPDASNATYFLGAAAMIPDSQCTIVGLGKNSIQGDVEFACVLEQMGATVHVTDQSITVAGPTSSEKLRGIDVDLNAMPDTAQTLAVIALLADGPTIMRNIGNLRVKETDRLAALQTELTKLGATITITGDDMTIVPPTNGVIQPAAIDTYDDHRMAMSFAIVGLTTPGITINKPSCVNKTYPNYFDDLAKLGEPDESDERGKPDDKPNKPGESKNRLENESKS